MVRQDLDDGVTEQKQEEEKVMVVPRVVTQAEMLNLIYDQNNQILNLTNQLVKLLQKN